MPVESFCVSTGEEKKVQPWSNLGYVVDRMIVYSANSRSSRSEAVDCENNWQL